MESLARLVVLIAHSCGLRCCAAGFPGCQRAGGCCGFRCCLAFHFCWRWLCCACLPPSMLECAGARKSAPIVIQQVCCGRPHSAARLPGAAFCAGTPAVQTVAHRSHAAAIASIPAGRVQRFAAYSAHVLPSAGRVSMRSNVKPSFPSKLSERWLSGATIATTRFRPALALA